MRLLSWADEARLWFDLERLAVERVISGFNLGHRGAQPLLEELRKHFCCFLVLESLTLGFRLIRFEDVTRPSRSQWAHNPGS